LAALLFDNDTIFNESATHFDELAEKIFRFQVANNGVYGQYAHLVAAHRSGHFSLTELPFLPISFFKTHQVSSFTEEPTMVFTSSGTTGLVLSQHFVKNADLYRQSFTRGFEFFYGRANQYAFLCLLPSYLERSGSSLVYMARDLIEQSGNADSGFFLGASGKLQQVLEKREATGQPSILLGVTFALLDFGKDFEGKLKHTIIMETGGMKGRKKEMTRAEVHHNLIEAFGVPAIHAEYGMTELMSQAYAQANGLYECPPWMRVLVREEDDPFSVKTIGAGLLCIVDLANVHSCSFIETNDVGRVYADGSFEVMGRLDNADLRGCSLMVV
jgi:hypothetical protein